MAKTEITIFLVVFILTLLFYNFYFQIHADEVNDITKHAHRIQNLMENKPPFYNNDVTYPVFVHSALVPLAKITNPLWAWIIFSSIVFAVFVVSVYVLIYKRTGSKIYGVLSLFFMFFITNLVWNFTQSGIHLQLLAMLITMPLLTHMSDRNKIIYSVFALPFLCLVHRVGLFMYVLVFIVMMWKNNLKYTLTILIIFTKKTQDQKSLTST